MTSDRNRRPRRAADMVPDWARQLGAEVAVDWGPNGLRAVGPGADAVVIVDVLRFTTTVDVAISGGITVIAHRWDRPGDAAAVAASRGAVLAARGSDAAGPSLSPASMLDLPIGTKVVLPSPNGSALVVGASEIGASTVIAGCLRNTAAVADALAGASRIAVIAAGERWGSGTGPVRFAIEDFLGAGAIADALQRQGRQLSAEATVAAQSFRAVGRVEVSATVADSASGRELIARGFADDIAMATDIDASTSVPTLVDDELRTVER